jgi:hypothetical protein
VIPTYGISRPLDGRLVIVKWEQDRGEFVEICTAHKDYAHDIVEALNDFDRKQYK